MKKLLALSSLLLLSAPTLAGSATGNVTVTAQVVDTCAVTGTGSGATGSNTTADFGVYSPGTGNVLGAGGAGLNMSVTCSLGTLYYASLGAGLNDSSGQRRLKNTTTATSFLNYSIGLLDASGILQETVGASLPYLGTGLPLPLVLKGTLAAGQNAKVGNYQDTVVLTITY